VLPRDTFSYVAGVLSFLSAARHRREVGGALGGEEVVPAALRAALRAGLLPPAALFHGALRFQFCEAGEGGGEGPYAQRREAGAAAAAHIAADPNYQRKVEAGGGAGGGEDGTAALRRALLTEVDASGRRHAPLLVVASLVDKAPNLGGLARTAEILAAAALVVPAEKVVKDAAFQATSLDAEKRLPICTVPPADLLHYVRAQKARGWVVVALEQAAHSVRLGSEQCVLPERMLLVLGAEKEGLPPQLLAEADVVVEITQLGVLRSLNVHVSAALVMFEHNRQRAARCALT